MNPLARLAEAGPAVVEGVQEVQEAQEAQEVVRRPEGQEEHLALGRAAEGAEAEEHGQRRTGLAQERSAVTAEGPGPGPGWGPVGRVVPDLEDLARDLGPAAQLPGAEPLLAEEETALPSCEKAWCKRAAANDSSSCTTSAGRR
jgi:hypothetical protein